MDFPTSGQLSMTVLRQRTRISTSGVGCVRGHAKGRGQEQQLAWRAEQRAPQAYGIGPVKSPKADSMTLTWSSIGHESFASGTPRWTPVKMGWKATKRLQNRKLRVNYQLHKDMPKLPEAVGDCIRLKRFEQSTPFFKQRAYLARVIHYFS